MVENLETITVKTEEDINPLIKEIEIWEKIEQEVKCNLDIGDHLKYIKKKNPKDPDDMK